MGASLFVSLRVCVSVCICVTVGVSLLVQNGALDIADAQFFEE
jgi:hypothetical protein